MSVIVKILPLGGTWETLGVDRLRGITPENIVASSNEWGPSSFDFTLRAEKGARRPDVLPYTPVELYIDGVRCWGGFVWQRPSDENGYSVGCRGWQYHLDDDLFDKMYVHTRLADYVDNRSYLAANLGKMTASGKVVATDGAIILGWAKGDTLVANTGVGVTLDLGPDCRAIRGVLGWEYLDPGVNDVTLYFRISDTADPHVGAGYDDLGTHVNNSGVAGTIVGTGSASRRYVHVFMYYTGGGGVVGQDIRNRIVGINLFASTNYESGNASILKADMVVKDVLTRASLLNQSAALISAGTFNIPEYLTGGYVTPRQAMEAVNALENYRLKIGGGDLRSLVYGPKPSAPIAEVGEWSGAQFADATISGEEIYNKGIVDGTGPDGARLVRKRGSAAIAASVAKDHIGGALGGTINGPAQVGVYGTNVLGGLKKGVPYLVTLYGGTIDVTGASTFRVRIGGNAADSTAAAPDDYVEFLFSLSADGAVAAQTPQVWIPSKDYANQEAELYILTGTENSMAISYRIDRGSSLLDRRGFSRARRIDVSAAVSSAVGDRIADLWLAEHLTAPFAGTLTITGRGARLINGGRTIAPYEFLLNAGEKIRLNNRVDPDTGAWGRDGRIAGATYRHDDRTVEIAIDDQRQRFETILSRYAVLVGG